MVLLGLGLMFWVWFMVMVSVSNEYQPSITCSAMVIATAMDSARTLKGLGLSFELGLGFA
jgi:hypothetical protein